MNDPSRSFSPLNNLSSKQVGLGHPTTRAPTKRSPVPSYRGDPGRAGKSNSRDPSLDRGAPHKDRVDSHQQKSTTREEVGATDQIDMDFLKSFEMTAWGQAPTHDAQPSREDDKKSRSQEEKRESVKMYHTDEMDVSGQGSFVPTPEASETASPPVSEQVLCAYCYNHFPTVFTVLR